jgi:hypothetical protein
MRRESVKDPETAIGNIPDRTINIGANVNVPEMPSFDWSGYEQFANAIPIADGGRGRVTRPTLFLAGEAGRGGRGVQWRRAEFWPRRRHG